VRHQGRCLRELTAAGLVVLLCLFAAVAVSCGTALPTHYAAEDSVSYDDRVAELRRLLRAVYHLEALPDPPLELGIHTPCRKFGRGCPDTYVAFLEDVVASLRSAAVEKEREDFSLEVVHAAPEDAKEECIAAKSLLPTDSAAEMASLSVNSPLVLRLPVQAEWPYKQFKRLESMLVRVKVAEIQLERDGIPIHELQRRHRLPRGENLVLQDDSAGAVSAHLSSACSLLRRRGPTTSAALQLSGEEAMLHEAWCRYVEYRSATKWEGVQHDLPSALAFRLAALPSTPLPCYVMDLRRWYAEALLVLDPLLTFLVSLTWSVALPSAAITAVFLWVCVDDGWGENAEQLIFCTSEPAEPPDEGEADHDASDSHERFAEQQYRQSRAAGLRFTFMEQAQHRSWPMRMLKLRLVLCLLVAADLLWSFGQILCANLWPTAGAAAAAASNRPILSTSLRFLLQLFPAWLRIAVNVYVVAVLQGAVLVVALRGAANAYADWQSFTAQCATEQEYLLRATVDASREAPL
jgi:hypothetical protein